MRRRLRAVAGVAGAIAILAGFLVGTDPGFLGYLPFLAEIRGGIGGLEPTLVMLFAGVVLLGGSVVSLHRRGSDTGHETPLWSGREPESPGDGRRIVGAAFDRRLETALDGDGGALDAIRTRLRHQAVLATDADPDEAAGIRAGYWTDDRLAAAFLGDESGPPAPLAARLRWLVDPVGERKRRVERSIAAIEAEREARE